MWVWVWVGWDVGAEALKSCRRLPAALPRDLPRMDGSFVRCVCMLDLSSACNSGNSDNSKFLKEYR